MADGNKTEQATPRRRQKAREQGSVARSREFPSVLAMATVVGVAMIVAPHSIQYWSMLYRETLNVAATQSIDVNGPVLFWTSIEAFRWIVPILLAGMTVSVMAALAQGGIVIAPEALQPKIGRMSPASKLKQIFSPMGLGNMMKSLLPFAAIAWISVSAIRGHWVAILSTSSLGVRALANLIGSSMFEIGWKSVLVLLAWSGVDYLLIWRKNESDLKMSKEEVKEEHKETDGNPIIKRRIHQVRRAMRKSNSLKAAATATVVITNPTHFAVALRYEQDMPAPIVVAKGVDLLALQIREIAKENNIMTVENRPLAQALYKSVEVGDSIPSKLYQAVAEILVIVYKAQAEVRQAEERRRSRNASGQPAGPANKVAAKPAAAKGAKPQVQTGAAR